MADRFEAILDRFAAGELPANVALMQLLVEARSRADVEDAICRRAAGTPREAGLQRLRQLLAENPSAFETVRAVMAEADHAGEAGGPDHWAAVFDGLAREAPEAGVALYALGSPALLQAATAEAVDRMRAWGLLGPDRRVLEIGCGIGRLALALAPEVEHVLGLDVSGEMIAEARRRGAGIPNARFEQSSGEDLRGVANASVDLVLAADVFPYLVASGPDLASRHIAEAARVLRPGGALLILNFSYRGDPDRDRAEVAQAFAAHAFRLDRDGTRDLALWDATAFLGRSMR